jgi:hypothetical protein
MSDTCAGTHLIVYETDGKIFVDALEEPRVSAAVSQYIDSGKTKDTLLDLTLIGGAAYYVRTSNIVSWLISTPSFRRSWEEYDAAMEEEKKALKAEFGSWEGD